MIGTKQPQMEFRSIKPMHEKISRNYGLTRNNETTHYAHRSIDLFLWSINSRPMVQKRRISSWPWCDFYIFTIISAIVRLHFLFQNILWSPFNFGKTKFWVYLLKKFLDPIFIFFIRLSIIFRWSEFSLIPCLRHLEICWILIQI